MLNKLTTMLTAFAVALPVSVPLTPAAFGQTPDDVPVVIRLVEEGLSPAEAIRNGAAVDAVMPGTLETAMHIAAKRNRLDIARELSGWDVLTNMLDIRGQTALHAAAARGYQEMAEFLLDEGYDPDIRDAQGRAAIDLTPPNAAALREILAPFFINPNRVRDLETGRTGLHLLALSGTPEQVREALAGGPNRGVEDNAGLTPVHLAAQRGDVEVMRALLDGGHEYLAQLGGRDGRNACISPWKTSTPIWQCSWLKPALTSASRTTRRQRRALRRPQGQPRSSGRDAKALRRFGFSRFGQPRGAGSLSGGPGGGSG